ncbi:MAG TPA: phosphate signaling complex protein PhoU [Myxococcales bacterium]|jgi:phosphate transport system protein|nr:phosphate signaling complex protein PhoU [Myxococcales bacterium]
MKAHTDKTYDAQLDDLRNKLLSLGGKVETGIATSMRALQERDSKLAEQVIASDREVNRLEVEIDEACRRLLVLRQPAASDLRFITTALKIVVDLERIGDLAVNVAERAIDLNQSPPLRPVHDLTKLAQLCQQQVRAALDAFVDGDPTRAEAVIQHDELVDSIYHNLFNELLALMMEDPRNIRRANSLLFVAKHLERLADHATNVAEMVIYMVRGTDVRHPGSRASKSVPPA